MDRSEWPPVSIVFLAYNRREELAASLTKILEELDYPADRLEVIVVDNASTDGTADMVRERFPEVLLIRSPQNVGASAWNAGMATARGEWRMILDDDCHIEGDALKVAVARAEEHDADLVSFRVVSGTTPGYAFEDEYRTGLLTFWGCAAMFSRRAIESEPFYDPWIFIWANEMELTMRYLHRGFRRLHLPEVEAIHMKDPRGGYADRPTRLNARHFAYIAAKNLRARDAVGALGNLTGHVLLQVVAEDRRARVALPEIVRGLVGGLKARSPVRPEVSRLYRRNTWHFATPLAIVRTPLDRLRGDVVDARMEKARRFYEARREYYPEDETAALAL